MSVFAYGPQRDAINSLLAETGLELDRVIWVWNVHPMRGVVGGTFLNVTNHPEQTPQEVFEAIRIYGFLTVDFSDEHLRGRLAAKHAGTQS